MSRELPAWRSILYVPANVPRFVAAAHRSGADAIQLDLEDSILPSEKSSARSGLGEAIETVSRSGADVMVRINRPLSLAIRDVEAAVCRQVRALTITKIASASHVRLIEEVIEEREAALGLKVGHTGLVLLVETVQALQQVHEIAAASGRVVGLALGTEDFAADAQSAPSEEVMLMPKQMLVLAARAAGVLPIGFIGSVASLGDDSGFRKMLQRSRSFGFECATCIHPGQVAIVNDEYGVSADELARAQRIVQESKRQGLLGIGAFRLDGKLVDAPVVLQAERCLQRAAALTRGASASGSE